jgi:hypothetical protein
MNAILKLCMAFFMLKCLHSKYILVIFDYNQLLIKYERLQDKNRR